jgi:ligand-binding sensor domain-containing protein
MMNRRPQFFGIYLDSQEYNCSRLKSRKTLRSVSVMTRNVSAALLILVLGTSCSALDVSRSIHQYVQESWSVRDGLPQDFIEAIIQTRDRHIWLGFRNDLVRFDGLQFKSAQEIVKRSLKGFEFVTLFEDHNGDIWAGSYGNGLVRLHQETITVFNKDDGLPSDFVWAIQEDKEGTLWVGTEHGGIAWFENGRFKRLDQIGASDEIISAILPDKDGGVWIGSHHSGLLHWLDHRMVSYPTGPANESEAILAMALDHDRGIWIGTENGKLLYFKNNQFQKVSADGLTGVQIQKLLVDRDGILWIGTFGSGLGRLVNGNLTMLTRETGLPDDEIWGLVEDDEGYLWIATRGGLFQLKDGEFTTFDKQEGLSDDSVWAVTQSTDGALWIGTDRGLNRFQNGTLNLFTAANGLPGSAIWSLASDSAGNVWAGTSSSGIAGLLNGKILSITEKDGLPGNAVRAVVVDRTGHLNIGTHGFGFAQYAEGKFQHYTTHDGLSDNFVRTLLVDREGNIWIGTDHGGLDRFRNGKFQNYSTKNGLKVNAINCLYEGSNGDLWIGTDEGGLSRLRNGKIDTITSNNGLFNDEIFSIVEDQKSNLWMGCDRAVFTVSAKDLDDFFSRKIKSIRSEIFDVSNGLKSSACSSGQPAALRTQDGKLWFATIGGVAVIDPSRPRSRRRIPDVQIDEIVIDDKAQLSAHLQQIQPGFHQIEIRFSAISFSEPHKLRFRYKLDPLSSDWSNPVQERVAGFSSLPAGDYKFIVQAGKDGTWGNSASLQLKVLPFFYQTTWFYFLAIGSLIGAVFLVIRLRTRSLVRSRSELESQVRQRTSDLEASNMRITQEVQERQRAETIAKSTLQARQAYPALCLPESTRGVRLPEKKRPAPLLSPFAFSRARNPVAWLRILQE